AIVRSAGGNVICDVEKVKDLTTTIFVASEDNMEEALTAIQKGIPTFSMIVSAEEEEFNSTSHVFTCGYIALQFFKLSPEESSKNPVYFVLARHQKGDVVGHKRRHSVVIAKVIVAALGCFMLGFLTHAIIVDGSPFQAKYFITQSPLRCTSSWCFDEKLFVQTLYKIDFSNEPQVVDAFEKEMERASTYLLSHLPLKKTNLHIMADLSLEHLMVTFRFCFFSLADHAFTISPVNSDTILRGVSKAWSPKPVSVGMCREESRYME
ncbi:reverse transcriptase, RNA-dependent DNA polymerase, partial [Tanacetum coccineum]